jgi:heptosyltransferase-2
VEPRGEPHAALFPGARYGSAKRWPGFGGLAAVLQESIGLPVVLYGSAAEEEELERTAAGIPECRVRAGMELPDLTAGLLKSVITVGNDSGGVHLSALLGIPTVTLFGSTSPVWTAPVGDLTAIVSSKTDCSPCFRRDCPRGDTRCLGLLTPEMVLEESLRLLDRSGRSGHA